MEIGLCRWGCSIGVFYHQQGSGGSWLADCSWIMNTSTCGTAPKQTRNGINGGRVCGSYCLICHSPYPSGRGGALVENWQTVWRVPPNPDGNLENVSDNPPSSPIPTVSLLLLFSLLFFLWFGRYKSRGAPSGQPQPLVHLPAIRDHKSSQWMEPLPSVVQGFDGVVTGGFDLRASPQQKGGTE